MSKLSSRLGVIGAVSALLLTGGAAAAHAEPVVEQAVPHPSSGPVSGGTAVTVPAPRGVTFTEIYPGGLHTLATGSDGLTYAWGYNAEGQLGTGDNTTSWLPRPITQPAGVSFVEIDAGAYHTVALGSDGNAYTWGQNSSGEIGNGTTTNINVPTKVEIPGGVAIAQINAGEYNSIALGVDGAMYGWGKNNAGQLGSGTTGNQLSPVAAVIPDDATLTQLSTGGHHTLALADDGRAFGWGLGTQGQLGQGSFTGSLAPVEVVLPQDVTFTRVDAGGHHSLGLGDDGRVYAWGANANGQLGNGGAPSASSNVPVAVDTPPGVEFDMIEAGMIAPNDAADDGSSTGAYHSLAIAKDGTTYAWGRNLNGQLGDGTNTDSATPVTVNAPAGVQFVSVGTGLFHSTAMGDNGAAYTWGYNATGQLGNDTDVDVNEPIEVRIPVDVTEVTFDGIAGTDLTQLEDGNWQATTPAHAAGPVDVVVRATQFGAELEPVVYPGGFTYVEDDPQPPVLPTITSPADLTVDAGDPARFSVTTTGDPAPTVLWEVSSDGGVTWGAVDAAWQVATDGHSSTLTLTATAEHSGLQFRATATDAANQSATSAAATLTVLTPSGPVGPGGSGGSGGSGGAITPTQPLPPTGGESAAGPAALAASLLALGIAALATGVVRVTRRSRGLR
ncbi:hypothetical protein ACI1US_02502 [Leucobacter sp. BZR 635]